MNIQTLKHNHKNFADELVMIRKDLGMTRSAFAVYLGVNPSTISAYEAPSTTSWSSRPTEAKWTEIQNRLQNDMDSDTLDGVPIGGVPISQVVDLYDTRKLPVSKTSSDKPKTVKVTGKYKKATFQPAAIDAKMNEFKMTTEQLQKLIKTNGIDVFGIALHAAILEVGAAIPEWVDQVSEKQLDDLDKALKGVVKSLQVKAV